MKAKLSKQVEYVNPVGADMRTIELHLPSRLGYERVAMDAAGSAARLMGFHQSRIEDLRTAVSEACINAMEHAHEFNAATKVVVALNIGDADLTIDVADQGEGIPESVESPDIKQKITGEQNARGWGIFLIRSLMDEAEFNVRSEYGNATRMLIRLDPEAPTDDD
jgi:serine/threonine-protein kinase RsbW